MKKFLFSLFLGLSLFLFNVDSSFANDVIEENSISSAKENTNKTDNLVQSLNFDKKIVSVKEVKRTNTDYTVYVFVFDDGTVIIVIVEN